MIKADKYLKETIVEILENGQWDKNPRTRWSDGVVAHSKFVTQKVYKYNISKGEFPINTLRTTPLKGAWHDIDAIYLKQTNVLEEMHRSIHSWWKDFLGEDGTTLGATYGHTVRRYDLMNKLLKGLEENPFGRRHSINLNQEQQKIDNPKALQPCAFETLWSVREEKWVIDDKESSNVSYSMCIIDFSKTPIDVNPLNIRYIDLTLIQRSQDLLVTSSINPAQYVMLGMMVCNHLTFKTGIKHEIGDLLHIVQNCHIYDRHLEAAKELLQRESTGLQPKIELACKPKDFYSHTVDDFLISGVSGIKDLTTKLELAI